MELRKAKFCHLYYLLFVQIVTFRRHRVRCHMGCRFTGALVYADDITLLDPCKSALSIMIDVCEQYAAEFDILFNGSKSKLLLFKVNLFL